MKAQADRQIEEMINDGIIEKVYHPTQWNFAAFFIPKPNQPNQYRFVCDFSPLNRVLERAPHPFAAASDIIKTIPPGCNIFLCLDLLHGYHQIELSRQASDFCTFLLPSGRYSYRRAAMGLSISSDLFLAATDKALQGTSEICAKLVDDLLVHAPDLVTLEHRARLVLDKLRAANIVVSKKKMKISDTVQFAGYQVSPSGIRPDPKRLSALLTLQPPTNISQLRGWIGALNQVNIFHPQLACFLHENNKLLKKGAAFLWTEEHDRAFNKTKELLKTHLEIAFYDPTQPTYLLTDASYTGMGFCLCQAASWTENNAKPRKYNLIIAGSRSLTQAEQQYSVSEIELTAITWAMKKTDYYVRGAPDLRIVTDHKPLVAILQKSFAAMPNQRILRLCLKLADYSFTISHNMGKEHCLPDLLSRFPELSPRSAREDDFVVNTTSVDENWSEDLTMRRLMEVAGDDKQYQLLLRRLQQQFRPRANFGDPYIRSFHSVWDELSTEQGLVIYQDRIVLPPTAIPQIVELLHRSHHQTDKTLAAARARYFWPNMKSTIMSVCKSCKSCITYLPSQQKEPLLPTTADRPFQKLGGDVVTVAGKKILIVVDRFSSFVWVLPMPNETASTVISKLENLFFEACFSPEAFRFDSATNFRSYEFADFTKRWNIKVEFSSPHYKQSNGMSEMGCKRTRHLLEKYDGVISKEFRHALNVQRSTPLMFNNVPGPSPVQLLYGRGTRDPHLPALPRFYDRINYEINDAAKDVAAKARKAVYDSSSRLLSLLRPNQRIAIQSPHSQRWSKFGRVIRNRDHSERSYLVEDDDGNVYERNRRYLRPLGSGDVFKKVSFAKPEKTIIP